jgi:hypothetical protein
MICDEKGWLKEKYQWLIKNNKLPKSKIHHMRNYLVIMVCLIAIIADSGFINNTVESTIPPKKKYALLIGINEYPRVRKLKGAINDIALIQDLLLKRGFLKNNIKLLPNERATKSNMEQSFKNLIATVHAGDIVVIQFSGHGSQVKDNEINEEADGLDETLIPFDYVHSAERARKTSLTDDELGYFLNQLTSKNANVTLIIDACHSGGITRDPDLSFGEEDFSDRYVEMVDRPDRSGRSLQVDGNSGFIDDNPGFRSKAAAYVLVTSCRSDQKARETTIGKESYGILTQALYSELENTGGVQIWPDIIKNIRYNVQRKNYNQTPQLEGQNADSYVFGNNIKLDKQFILVSPGPNNTITVDAGQVQGITKGSVFKVYPPGTIDFKIARPVAEIEITQTASTFSTAKVIKGKVNAINSKAREFRHHYYGSTLNIAFTGNWQSSSLQDVRSAVKTIQSVKEDNQNPYIILNAKGNAVSVSFGNDKTHILNKYSVTDPGLKAKLENEVERWRKWFHVFGISNPVSKLKIALDIKTKTRDPESSRSLERIKRPDYIFNDSEEITLYIHNLSDEKVFVNILNLRDNGTIKPYSLGGLLDHASNDAIDPGKKVAVDLTLNVREGMQKNLDIMKVFATTSDISFDFLEQGRSMSSGAPIQDLVDRGDHDRSWMIAVDDWSTLEKVIMVKKQ